MNDERSGLRADDVADPEVSALYSELAAERTPASLNEAVLRQATRTAGRGYARSIAWMRPMAWAATIGLCLAIVIELADVAEPEIGADGLAGAVRSKPAVPPEAAAGREPATIGTGAFHVTDAPLLEEAAAIARLRGESDGTAVRPLAGSGAVGSGPAACSAEAKAKPETWLDCIRALREAGRDAEAEEQEALLLAAFPDFDVR